MVETAAVLELEGEARREALRRKAEEAERERRHAEAIERRKAEEERGAGGDDGLCYAALSSSSHKLRFKPRARPLCQSGRCSSSFEISNKKPVSFS